MTTAEIMLLLLEAERPAHHPRCGVEAGTVSCDDNCHVDLVYRLVAVVRKLTGWRPMELAPRDGTRILVVSTDGEVVVARWKPSGPIGSKCIVPWVLDQAGRYWAELAIVGWLPLPSVPREVAP